MQTHLNEPMISYKLTKPTLAIAIYKLKKCQTDMIDFRFQLLYRKDLSIYFKWIISNWWPCCFHNIAIFQNWRKSFTHDL